MRVEEMDVGRFARGDRAAKAVFSMISLLAALTHHYLLTVSTLYSVLVNVYL